MREKISAQLQLEKSKKRAVDTKFVEVLAFRQSHKSIFEKSDIFFLCLLEPISFQIQKQESEIEAAKVNSPRLVKPLMVISNLPQWMPVEEYAAQPFVQKDELSKYIVDICLAKKDRNYSGFSPVPTSSVFSDEKSYMYFNICDLNGK